jgi:membrane dipeptidase
LSKDSAVPAPQYDKVPYVDGLENPTENFHNIAAWLVSEGFTDEDIIKVLGGNVIRALVDIWA